MTGLAAACARGRMGDRPKSLDESQVKVAILRRSGPAIALANEGELTINEICKQVECSRSTYYRQVAPLLKKVMKEVIMQKLVSQRGLPLWFASL